MIEQMFCSVNGRGDERVARSAENQGPATQHFGALWRHVSRPDRMRAWGFATALGGDRPVSRTADRPCRSSTSAGAHEAPSRECGGASYIVRGRLAAAGPWSVAPVSRSLAGLRSAPAYQPPVGAGEIWRISAPGVLGRDWADSGLSPGCAGLRPLDSCTAAGRGAADPAEILLNSGRALLPQIFARFRSHPGQIRGA